MHPDLERLLDLQEKDLNLLDSDQRLKALLDELAALDGVLEEARVGAAATRQRIDESVGRRQELEHTIESQRLEQERRRSRIEQVRTAREVQALMSEMDQARSAAARNEAEWVRVSEQVQQQETELRAAAERVQALETDQSGGRGRLTESIATLEAERAVARQAREEAAARIDRALRHRYDRLWSTRATTVVVPLRGDACGACHTAIPRNRRSQIRAGVITEGCEACGVILYPPNGEP
ncbi:MAG: zinc ribbon domain-containing protein [Gemmatimonadales bacterium]